MTHPHRTLEAIAQDYANHCTLLGDRRLRTQLLEKEAHEIAQKIMQICLEKEKAEAYWSEHNERKQD